MVPGGTRISWVSLSPLGQGSIGENSPSPLAGTLKSAASIVRVLCCSCLVYPTLKLRSIPVDERQLVSHRERIGCRRTRDSHVLPAFVEGKPIRDTNR